MQLKLPIFKHKSNFITTLLYLMIYAGQYLVHFYHLYYILKLCKLQNFPPITVKSMIVKGISQIQIFRICFLSHVNAMI